MKRNPLLSVILLVLIANSSSAAPPAKAPKAAPAPAPAALEDLAGLAAGAMVVQRPEAPEGSAQAWFLFDEDPRTGWTSEDGKTGQPTVVELADRSVIRSIQIDTANDE